MPSALSSGRSRSWLCYTILICAPPAPLMSKKPGARNRQGTRRASVPITLSDYGWSAAVTRDPPYLHRPVTASVHFRGFTAIVAVLWDG
jgi:hypothetical protein